MFKKIKPNERVVINEIHQFPHCDSRVLHAPLECEYCDAHPEWQALRQAWGIAFTGYEPEEKELPDPASHARGLDTGQQMGRERGAASAIKQSPHSLYKP